MANRTEKIIKKLRVDLTDREKADLGREMADLQEELTSHDDALAQAKAEHKSAVTACEARATEIGGKLRAGSEYRQVDCERHYDYERGVVTETRLDLNEKVSERVMTESELQMEMELLDGSEGIDPEEQEEQPEGEPVEPALGPDDEVGKDDDEPAQEMDGGDQTDEEPNSYAHPAEGWDDDINQLVGVLRETKRCSINNIRRKLYWGYSKATRVLEKAEDLGIVGPPKGGAPREVLIDLDD